MMAGLNIDLVGFGISHPEHCRAAFDAGARLTVVGSHLARVIEAAVAAAVDREELIRDLQHALAPLCAAAGPSNRQTTDNGGCCQRRDWLRWPRQFSWPRS